MALRCHSGTGQTLLGMTASCSSARNTDGRQPHARADRLGGAPLCAQGGASLPRGGMKVITDLRVGVTRNWRCLSICVAATLLKLWLVSAQTVYAIAPSHVDDQHFLFHAASLLRGEWLGRLSDVTLVKGPVYPLWLALNHLAGMPLLVSQAILYAIACAVLALAIRPIVGAPWRRALLYLTVLFNPASWADGAATRVIREGIYASLTLLLIGLAIGAALRLREAPRASVSWAAAAGFVGALLAMTREEGVWVVPSVAIVALSPLARGTPLPWRCWFGAVGASALAFALPSAAIAGMNWSRYGLFETCETRAAYFTSAYGSLTRVKTSTWNPHVPVPLEARAKVFEVSPAFQEIAQHVEKDAPNWTSASCHALGVCDDIAGGWFMWAFRAAVASAGEYRDGPRARAWYERLSREVDEACRNGQLDCYPPRSTMMPPWRTDYLRPVASALGRGAVYAATFTEVTPYPTVPQGDERDLVEFERITNEQLPRPVVDLQGIVTSRAGEVVGSVVDHQGGPVDASIQRGMAVPSAVARGGERSIRFRVTARCSEECALLLFVADGRSLIVPLSEHPAPRGDPALTWTTESATLRPAAPRDRGREARLAVLAAITRTYAVAVPVLSVLAVVILAWRLVRAARSRALSVLPLLGLALLVAVATRLLLLALVDASSFPAINTLYLSPAYPLLLTFVALLLVGGRTQGTRTSTA